MPITSTSAHLHRIGWDIRECSVGTIPVNLRIIYNPIEKLAYFRLRAAIDLSTSPSFRYFYLDIPPNKIRNLTLRSKTRRSIDFRVSATTLIVPEQLETQSITDADRSMLTALWSLTQQNTLLVLLPENVDDLSHLAVMCEAVDRGELRPDPKQMDLKTLYRGQGGRVVQSADDSCFTPTSSSIVASPVIPRACTPWSNLYSMTKEDNSPPPTYVAAASPSSAPPLSPVLPGKDRKRPRTDSSTSDSYPDYRAWKHLDLAVGDRERIMAELLRRAEQKESACKKVMIDLDVKFARAQEVMAELTELNSKAEGKAEALREAGGQFLLQGKHREQTGRSRMSNISASSSTVTSPRSLASVSSDLSGRIQAYVDKQLDQLRGELAENFVDNESMERCVGDQVDSMLSQYVEEDQVMEMIEGGIDDAMAKLRERVIGALE